VTYTAVAIVVLGAGVLAGSLSWLTRRLIRIEVLRRHHEIGSAVFLQLGVIFAVLLAFVFSEVWNEYHIAANAMDQECGHLGGAAILAQDLAAPMREQLEASIRQYVSDVIDSEWPAMAERRTSDVASRSFRALWMQVAGLDVHEPGHAAIRAQILSLLSLAHQNRSTRLFEMVQSVPPLLWLLLIAFAVVLVGFLLCFGIEYIVSQVIFTALFAAGVAFVLVIVHLLDYPFEGALRLPPTNFQTTLQEVAALSGAAQP
jgi:amino acid transporter